jgi:hypothetical protein
VVLVGAVLASGCMRMTRGTMQTIDVQTSPPDARVTIRPAGGDYACPAHVSLPRKPSASINVPEAGGTSHAAYLVTASKPGYRDASAAVVSHVSGETFARNWVWIHPVFFGIGVLVDVTSGAAYELSPSNITLVLEPEPATAPAR